MRDLAILTFVTLDGVMQAPAEAWEDPTGGFERAGWARPYWDGVMAQVRREAMAASYDLLLGRTTYDNFLQAKSEAAKTGDHNPMDGAKKYVVTSSPEPLTWHNSEKISGDIPSEIARLKTDDGPLLQVHGSWQLIQVLLAHDLIDEFRLWIFPTFAGDGKRLFARAGPRHDLDLVKTEATGNGVVMMIYRHGAG